MKKIFTLCVVLCMSYLSMGATNLKHEFRATWLATVSGIDWPKTKATNDATREQQKQELIDILDKMKAGNLNAVCFQVRSLCDAMYQSSYEPWSIALTGTRGKDPGYDPLQFAIDEAHKRGMELHVWVNPFRASTSTLAATDMLWDNAGDWLIKYNNSSFSGYLIDPGYPESRAYVVKVLMEIINNYDVDGLVMDDYFYAYGGTTNQDSVAQALHYRASEVIDVNNNGNKIDDWRRSNVDNVIKAMYDSIQVVKPWVRFGMGPGGIWTTDSKAASAYGISLPSGISGSDIYNVLYCNTVEWIKGGYVDYVNPQIYWSTQVAAQDYDVLCQWWSTSVCEHFSNQLPNQKRVHHFPSLATYKAIQNNDGTYYSGYSDGYVEIQRELDANRKNLSSGYTGAVFYNTTSYLQMSEELAESHFTYTALAPPMEWKVKGDLAAPTNLQLSSTTLSWQHPTAERFTVYAYPKGIGVNTATSNPQYLQAVVYDKSFNTSSLGSLDDITIAVYTYDRYGVEHGVALYNADPNATDDPEPEPEPEPEPSNTITWELNGGEVNTSSIEVPSQSDLMLQFMNNYTSYFGTPTSDIDAFYPSNISGFLYRGFQTRGKFVNEMMLDESAGWKWLADYIVSTSASNSTIVSGLNKGEEVNWRYSIVAFFTASAGTNSTYTVDFSTAGQPSKWGTAYQIAHGAVLLPTYVTSAYTLPTPVHPSGYEFLGWYDNAEFAGSPLTTIPANWTGTLYAQWQENAPTIDPTWQILYTSNNDSIVTPYATDVFGANIVSNTYENGQGVITFDGPVTSIGEKAFYQCKSLASITIPNSVTSIGNSAFSSCSSLTSVTIGNSVTSIGEDAFYDCSSLTSVTINSDAIVNKAYSYNYSILNIFGSQVTEYIIGDEVTSIGEYAFYECSSLTSITIPNSVTSIGKWTFSWCSSLTSITIPNSVTSIGSPAFNGCSSLTSVTINSNDIVSREYTYSSNIGTIFGSQVTEYVIGNSVTSIGKYAFYKCSSLASITIPNSVTSIGEDAFYNCSSLTSITIPNSVTSIGSSAFRDCSSLTSVTIPENVTSIGDRAFYNCSSLTSITIPNSVTSIGYHAFYNCAFTKDNFINNSTLDAEKENYWGARVGDTEIDGLLIKDDTILVACRPHLTSVTIPNSVTSIGSSAFYYCSSLTSITIPNSVTSIGEDAFYYCSSLTSITIPNSVTSIGNYAFYYCSSLTSITIPNSVTSIGYDAFDGTAIYKDGSNWENDVLYIDNCLIEAKTSISGAYTIKDNTRLIADFAFYNCSSLTSVTIPNSVTSIGGGVFCGCKNLTNAVLSENMTSLPNNKRSDYTLGFFEGCSSLTSVTIPNSVTSIGEDAFSGCTSLTSITIPNSVTSIGSSAFRDCSSLTSITIPESVTSIGNYAFYYCSSLTSITIPNSVTSIGYDAFGNCIFTKDNFVNNSSLDAEENDFWGASIGNTEIDGLLIRNDTVIDCRKYVTSVTIPNSVTSIGSSAFSSCSSLTSITIPNSVTSIGNYAFHDCSSLTSIYLPYDIPIANQSSFDDSHFEKVKLYVPFESYENYKNDSIWNSFKNILYINNFYENNIRYSYIMDGEVLSASLLTEENFNKFTPISLIGSQNWHYDSKYGAKMSGYSDATQTTYSNEDWLISPTMDLSKHSSATLTFSHAFGPKASVPTTATQKAQYTCWISNDFNGDVTTATWTELPITYGTSAWSFITTTVDIPAENLKENCHIAWKYVCTTSSATWEIKSVEIGGSYTKPAVKVIAKNDKYSNDVVIPSVVTHNYKDYSVETIAANAFSSCPSLTSITIGNNVKSIENYAFESCSSLTSVMLSGKIETIGKNAFSGCTALNEITLPASVKSIGENAFAGCTKLYDIYCYAMEPPTAYESSFANYNAFLHVPCDNQRVYLLDVIFGNFKYIECIEAETTPTDTVVVTPSFNDAEFIWPSNSSADSYTLAISKDGEVFCTLTFNANGQLTGIAFAPSRNGQHNAPAAAQTANGFAFTVTGLDEGSNYTYNLLIQDRSGNTLKSYSGEFRTQSTNDRTVTVEYDAAQGQVTGAGTYLVGDTVTLTAIPNYGYHFVQWSDGNTDNPRTLVLTQDTILTAEFALTISGQCGDNLYWAYDEASKTIAITGSGDMYDYTKDTQPWLLFQDQITEVTTSNTTTSIGDWAFDDCSGLTSVTIGNSVTSIGEQAFNGCSSLTSITIPNSVTSIGEGAFEYCSSLDTIHVEATTPPALEDSTVFMNTPSPVCVIPCGTLATYQSSDWANQVGSFVEDCPPASAAITYVLNGGVQSEWETPQTMYNELNAVWNAFSGTSKTWGNLEDLKANVANGIPTQAGTMALDFIADENFKAKFEWLVTYMDAKCTEQGQTLPSSNASFLRYNLQAFFIDGMRTSWPISADYTICGVSTVEAYQPYWKSGFANPTNPTEEFVLNAPYREGYTFAGWYTTPDFSGKKVTTVNSETTGTLYAKWVEYIPTIAEVWNMEEGVETKILGVVNWVRYGNVFIQDITGGFRVYIPNDSTRLIPEVGTKIIAKGVRGSFAGSPQLNDAVIESSEPATLAEPIVTTLTDLCANPLKYFGQRVSVQGVYVAEYDSYGNIYVAERGGSNKVKGHYMVVDPIAFPVGTNVSITAVASQYDGAFQFEGDIAGIELAPGPKRDTYEYPIRNEKYTLTNDWVISNIEGNFAANKLAQTDSLFVRGMAAKDGIMYFINRETQSLIRVDGATGHMLDPIKITGEHLFEVYDEEMGEWKSGVIFGYNDIKFDQAGNCLIGACTTGGATRCQTFFIYIVDLETGVCTKLIEDVLWDNPSLDQVQFRFDAFGVAGDVTKNGVVMAADAQSWNVYRWLIKNGVVGDGEQINCALNAEIDESLFIETENFGTAPQIFPQDELGELFYVDGASTLPMLFDGDGMLLDDFINVPTGRNVWNNYGDTISINSGHLNGLIEFQVGEEYFLLMAATYSTHNVPSTFALYKFADENRAFSSMEPLWYFPHNGMGSNTNGYRTAVPSVDIIDNNTAKLYLYVGENGYACYTLNVGDKTVEPIDPTWQITYTSSNDSIVTPYATDVFGANIVSNTYENGVGTITFDGPVTSIGEEAFRQCSSIASITIPKSVTSIGQFAFGFCSSLTSITIPENVTSIVRGTFQGCSSIVSIVVDNNNTMYDSRNDCNAIIETATNVLVTGCKNTIIPNGITTIDRWAFASNKSLASITIPNTVMTIADHAFHSCSSLPFISIPNSVTSIGVQAFYNCSLFSSFTIPKSVTTIGKMAFKDCTSLDTIYVEATTPPTLGENVLGYSPVFTSSPLCYLPCGTLSAYEASDWAQYVSEFVEEGCAPIQMCGDDLYWEYADGLLTITGTGDMYDYVADTDVPWYDVRDSIKTINMPNEMTKIGDYTFYRCTALTSISLPEQLKHIGNRAFAQDTKIAGEVVIPEGVTDIADRAFYNCNKVNRFTLLPLTSPTLGEKVFDNTSASFYISCEAMKEYEAATNWSSLKSRLRDACLNIYHYNTALGANGVHTTEDTLVASIYYRRQFTTSRWETLYLPFEVDRVTVLEDGVEYDLNAWSIFSGGHYYLAKPYGIENKEIVFGFTQVVDAHTPYIIQFKEPYYHDKMITFHGKESWNKLNTSFEALPISFEMQMAGNTTLQDQILEEPVYMLRASSNFILQNTTTTLHPFECYVIPSATSSGAPARMSVRFRGDVPTAVESVMGNESHLTYSVDGYTLTVYPQGQAFSIYSLNGALIYSCEAGKEAVDCELNSGCYLLHAGTEAHKIML